MSKMPLDTIDNIRAAAKVHWEEGKKIVGHFKKMEEYYLQWEDDLLEIERAIEALQDETGVTKEEVFAKPSKPPKIEAELDIDDFLKS